MQVRPSMMMAAANAAGASNAAGADAAANATGVGETNKGG